MSFDVSKPAEATTADEIYKKLNYLPITRKTVDSEMQTGAEKFVHLKNSQPESSAVTEDVQRTKTTIVRSPPECIFPSVSTTDSLERSRNQGCIPKIELIPSESSTSNRESKSCNENKAVDQNCNAGCHELKNSFFPCLDLYSSVIMNNDGLMQSRNIPEKENSSLNVHCDEAGGDGFRNDSFSKSNTQVDCREKRSSGKYAKDVNVSNLLTLERSDFTSEDCETSLEKMRLPSIPVTCTEFKTSKTKDSLVSQVKPDIICEFEDAFSDCNKKHRGCNCFESLADQEMINVKNGAKRLHKSECLNDEEIMVTNGMGTTEFRALRGGMEDSSKFKALENENLLVDTSCSGKIPDTVTLRRKPNAAAHIVGVGLDAELSQVLQRRSNYLSDWEVNMSRPTVSEAEGQILKYEQQLQEDKTRRLCHLNAASPVIVNEQLSKILKERKTAVDCTLFAETSLNKDLEVSDVNKLTKKKKVPTATLR